MTELPSEGSGAAAQAWGASKTFSRSGVQERGDASGWTDTPAERRRREEAEAAGSSGPALPMSLAEAARVAAANKGKRALGGSSGGAKGGEGGEGGDGRPAPKSLVQLVEEGAVKPKGAEKSKAEWEGKHPWRPWNRETDLDVRQANPKGKESILNNQHMGKLGDRFGGGRRETTFM